jgi:hypothetical protein
MSNLEKIAEQKILAAIKAGDFDHLQGKGKPLQLEENSSVPHDLRLANKLLKDSGFKLPWLERWQEIEDEIRSLMRSFHSTWCTAQLETEKNQCKKIFAEKISSINGRILDYNLIVPLPAFQKPILYLKKEIESITAMEMNTKKERLER